jgi:hypothetical protein
MTASRSLRDSLVQLCRFWTRLERGWQAVVLAYLVVALVVLAP